MVKHTIYPGVHAKRQNKIRN